MFTNKTEEVTSLRLVAKSGAQYDIRLVKGDLHKFGRDSEGRKVEIKCSYGVSVGGDGTSHEYNFKTKREACDFYGRVISEKLYAGYRFENAVK